MVRISLVLQHRYKPETVVHDMDLIHLKSPKKPPLRQSLICQLAFLQLTRLQDDDDLLLLGPYGMDGSSEPILDSPNFFEIFWNL